MNRLRWQPYPDAHGFISYPLGMDRKHAYACIWPEGVSPTAWRMWKRGRLKKVREGLYAAPEKNEAADRKSVGDGSEASDSTPAQGGEARPGGGT